MAQSKARNTALPGRLLGYARVSTEEQGTDPQCHELRAAGCAITLEEPPKQLSNTIRILAPAQAMRARVGADIPRYATLSLGKLTTHRYWLDIQLSRYIWFDAGVGKVRVRTTRYRAAWPLPLEQLARMGTAPNLALPRQPAPRDKQLEPD